MNHPVYTRAHDKQHHTYYTKYRATDASGRQGVHEFYTESYSEWCRFLADVGLDNIVLPTGEEPWPAPLVSGLTGKEIPAPANLAGANQDNQGTLKLG